MFGFCSWTSNHCIRLPILRIAHGMVLNYKLATATNEQITKELYQVLRPVVRAQVQEAKRHGLSNKRIYSYYSVLRSTIEKSWNRKWRHATWFWNSEAVMSIVAWLVDLYDRESIRNVLEEEFVESLQRHDPPGPVADNEDSLPSVTSSIEPAAHIPSPTPESDATDPSDQGHGKGTAPELPPSRPTGLYTEDGYDVGSHEGLRRLNRDFLQAVRRLTPHCFNGVARALYPKAWAKLQDMRRQDRGHQARAANSANQNQAPSGRMSDTNAGE
ncbi:uncharacterized protein N0V89_007023 [Didymosphaeria variabile]|uniref:Uncharacterized protein n=1 Tax=Didymosphaeria variabile TaxID=1932322 RepID=A0A9W8XKP3_9PLEO|nr:uncharacterized protein N0V89_007023 [Didymosphaeria variabile]KAJ4351680.1 hypothetical protein N0V89_007023 [Didymosphaeria variabile]